MPRPSTVLQARAESNVEPALPAEPRGYEESYDGDVTTRTPRVFVATLVAIAFVGGIALAITHPWDPDAYSIKAKTEADTSMVGYPGRVERLTSQDSVTSEAPDEDLPLSPEETTYRSLVTAWEDFCDIEGRLTASEQRVRALAESGGSPEDTQEGASEQGSCSIELSNLIARVDETDVSAGAYVQDVNNLSTLGNWLRNWSDALTEAWSRAEAASGAASDDICTPLDNAAGPSGTNTFHSLFLQNYENWKPAEPPEADAAE